MSPVFNDVNDNVGFSLQQQHRQGELREARLDSK